MQITDEAKAFVAEKGYDVQFGARPLKRAIQTYIEDSVCELILNNQAPQATNTAAMLLTIIVNKKAKDERLTITIE